MMLFLAGLLSLPAQGDEIREQRPGERTWRVPITTLRASDAAKLLREILGSRAKLVADDRANQILVTATEAVYLRLLSLVRPHPAPDRIGVLHVYCLRNADAQALAGILSVLLPLSKATLGGKIRMRADRPTNSLVVTASASDFEILKKLLAELDQPSASGRP
jgi:general secretion pathway protein D